MNAGLGARVQELTAAAGHLQAAGGGYIVAHLAAIAAVRETMGTEPRFPGGWRSPEHLLLARGIPRRQRHDPQAGTGQLRQCFANACERIMADTGRWIYCEGYAMSDYCSLPVHHAWVLDSLDGSAVEVTWPEDWQGMVCIGVPVQASVVFDAVRKSGSVLQDYRRGYPVLTGEIEMDEWWHPAIQHPGPP